MILDLDSGDLAESFTPPLHDFGVFDAIVSGDGAAVVVSSFADLDPTVGNVDSNLELFVYDRAAGTYTQVTETTDGVRTYPNGCSSYRALVSGDAAVIGLSFYRISIETCRLDGPQRNEADGFDFLRARAVRKRPGNRPPELAAVADVRIPLGQPLEMTFEARDPDDDPLFFYFQVIGDTDIPAGSTIENDRHGHAVFRWTPGDEQTGVQRLRVGVYDEGGGFVLRDFDIIVDGPAVPCPGDCDGDGQVDVSELLTGVSVLLGRAPLGACPAADVDRGASVTVDELQSAVRNALDGCGL